MDLGLKGERAVVMGASAGIGHAIAQALVLEGARVVICSRDLGRITNAAQQIGAEAGIACDLSKAGEATRFVREAETRLGGVDILVCNTGGPPKGLFQEVTPEMWREGFQALWLSTVEAMQAALPGMRARKHGRIQVVTSISAQEPMPGLTVSNGLRAGLHGLLKSASQEVAADGVTVNALAPGFTRTERLAELGIDFEKIAAGIPARRLGEPEELAAVSAFLASRQAAYVTGQWLSVDGGWLKSN